MNYIICYVFVRKQQPRSFLPCLLYPYEMGICVVHVEKITLLFI